MKEIKPYTQKYAHLNLVIQLDDWDYAQHFSFTWHVTKRRNTFYAVRNKNIDGKIKQVYLHREIAETPKGFDTDHKDGNGLNCQRENLRTATRSQNSRNKTASFSSSSKYLGVSKYKTKDGERFRARINIEDKIYNLGSHKTEIEAALAYNYGAQIYYGEFANLNKVYCNPCIINPNNFISIFANG